MLDVECWMLGFGLWALGFGQKKINVLVSVKN
jgi:hypothetical protein